MLQQTHTPSQILKVANEEWGYRTRRTKKGGGNPLSVTGLYHIFHNPFYYGRFEYPKGSKKWYQGKHEPMISKSEFDQVQAFLGRKGKTRPSQHFDFAFRGLIRCADCAGVITAEEKKQVICTRCRFKFSYRNRDKCPKCSIPISKMPTPLFLRYVYYHCAKRSKVRCNQPSVEVNALEKQIEEHLSRIQISTRMKEWALTYLDELYLEENHSVQDIIDSRAKAYNDCLKRLESLVNLRTDPANIDGTLLSDEEYGKRRAELLAEKTRLNPSGITSKQMSQEALKQSRTSFDVAYSARRKFVEGDFQTKNEILTTIGSNLTLRDKKLIFEAKLPFTLLQTMAARPLVKKGRFEPEKNVAAQGQKPRTEPLTIRRLGDLDDVRTQMRKSERAAALIYAHFKKEFEMQDKI